MILLGISLWYVFNIYFIYFPQGKKFMERSTPDNALVVIVSGWLQVKQLHDWLVHWNEQFLDAGKKGKGKKQNDSGAKKAVLLSGTPGIGKTTSAKLVSQMLGFQTIEVRQLSLIFSLPSFWKP